MFFLLSRFLMHSEAYTTRNSSFENMAESLAGQLVLSCSCRMMPDILQLNIMKYFTHLLHFRFLFFSL